jgi:hypothetical protein
MNATNAASGLIDTIPRAVSAPARAFLCRQGARDKQFPIALLVGADEMIE